MKTIFIHIAVLLVFLLFSCGRDQIIFIGGGEEDVVKLEVFPKAVFIGYKIMITGPEDFDFKWRMKDPKVLFSDSIWVNPDSVINDTLYATVPYTNGSGKITVITADGEFLTDIITIINNCEEIACVTNWDVNYPITKEDSYPRYWKVPWLYQVKGDTICLSLEGYPPNQTIIKNLYFKQDTLALHPKFIKGSYYIYSAGIRRFEIDTAIVKIYQWNENGVYAGKIFSTPRGGYPVRDVFWADSLKSE